MLRRDDQNDGEMVMRSCDSCDFSEQIGDVGRRFRTELKWPEDKLHRGLFAVQKGRQKEGDWWCYNEGK